MEDPLFVPTVTPPSSSEQHHSSNSSVDDTSTEVQEAWSCFVVLVTLCFFVSMTMIVGVYASRELLLGPNTSRILGVYSFFVQDIEVRVRENETSAPMLYGFLKRPNLDAQASWFEAHSAVVEAGFHQEWIFYLNEGSEVNISYKVNPDSSFPLSLVIAEGKENLREWAEDPSYPNTTLSWNIIEGSGFIRQKIFEPSDYYIAVGNLNLQNAEVELNFSIQASMFNTTGAYYKCSLANNVCKVKLFFMRTCIALLTTPSTGEIAETNYWSAQVSYKPRWIAYITGSGSITVIVLLAMQIFTKFKTALEEASEDRERNQQRTERAPLLGDKNDDIEVGSSDESVLNNEEDDENKLVTTSAEGLPSKDNDPNSTRRVCVICFDVWRDCFFLPCGHWAACLACGTRIAEETGVCPICRKKIKVVRKIITV